MGDEILEAERFGIDGPLDEGEDEGDDAQQLPMRGARHSDYPWAVGYVQARNYTRWTAVQPRRIDRLVIHITDGGADYRNTGRYFSETTRQASAHYVVGRAGEVLQCVANVDVAWHAHGANRRSIGIEHCARTPGERSATDPGLAVTPAQYAASAKLVRWLASQHGVALDRQHVLGHREADATTSHTRCPDAVWDWERYFAELVAVA